MATADPIERLLPLLSELTPVFRYGRRPENTELCKGGFHSNDIVVDEETGDCFCGACGADMM